MNDNALAKISVAALPSRRVAESLPPSVGVTKFTVASMDNTPNSRRFLMERARRYLLEQIEGDPQRRADESLPRLIISALEKLSMSRSRERILANLDEMYREAFERAKTSGDDSQMATLDFAYRREQLYFEILLDVRDAVEKRG